MPTATRSSRRGRPARRPARRSSGRAAGRARRRPGLGVLLALLLLAGVGLGGWFAANRWSSAVVLRERCSVEVDGERTSLDLEQAANAATIAAVASREGVGERGVVIGLAAALQESKLRNIDYGDRDSVGLFQQRPSQGWGTRAQILDPVYASTRFFAALQDVPYDSLSVTDAAQAVQRSAYGDLYAQHEGQARLLAAALTGRAEAAFSCGFRGGAASGGESGAAGSSERATAVRRALEREFGAQRLTVRAASGASGSGSALTVEPQASGAAGRRQGWAVASWLVAHAGDMQVTGVRHDGQAWTAARSARGWEPATAGASSAAVRVELG